MKTRFKMQAEAPWWPPHEAEDIQAYPRLHQAPRAALPAVAVGNEVCPVCAIICPVCAIICPACAILCPACATICPVCATICPACAIIFPVCAIIICPACAIMLALLRWASAAESFLSWGRSLCTCSTAPRQTQCGAQEAKMSFIEPP